MVASLKKNKFMATGLKSEFIYMYIKFYLPMLKNTIENDPFENNNPNKTRKKNFFYFSTINKGEFFFFKKRQKFKIVVVGSCREGGRDKGLNYIYIANCKLQTTLTRGLGSKFRIFGTKNREIAFI